MSGKLNHIRELNGARGRNRTTDTRIFKPKFLTGIQPLNCELRVKPITKDQALIPILSNLIRGLTGAEKLPGGSNV